MYKSSQTRLINEILRNFSNKETKSFCVFLGAGSSYTSGIPLASRIVEILKRVCFNRILNSKNRVEENWQNLSEFYASLEKISYDNKEVYDSYTKQIEEEYCKKNYKPELCDQINTGQFLDDNRYGLWFEQYSSDPLERQRFVERIIDGKEPSVGYFFLAKLIEAGIVKNVFTTNFDDLVNESLLFFSGIKSRVYAHNEVAQYIRFSDSTKPNIIKLHGDYLYENIKNIQSETSSLESNMLEKLEEALSTENILFVGYGGADMSVMNALKAISKRKEIKAFWCDLSTESINWRAKQFLEESEESYFIQIRGFDDLFYEIYYAAGLQKSTTSLTEKTQMTETKVQKNIDSFKRKRIKKSHKLCGVIHQPLLSLGNGYELYELCERQSTSVESKRVFYKALIELNPFSELLFNNYAVYLIQQGDYTLGLKVIKEGLNIEPDNFLLNYNLGVIYYDQKQVKESQLAFIKSISCNSNFSQSFNNLAVTYNFQKSYNQALQEIDKALVLQIKSKYLINKGVVLKNLEQFDEALEYYERAISTKEDLGRAFYNKGNCLRLMGCLEEALEACSDALKYDKSNEYIFATKAQIYAQLNMDDEFYENLELSLNLNYPLWRHLDDPGFESYKSQKLFIDFLNKYAPYIH